MHSGSDSAERNCISLHSNVCACALAHMHSTREISVAGKMEIGTTA